MRKTRPARRTLHAVCQWVQDDDGNWETDCEHMFVLNDGLPSEHHMRFCCYCGKPLKERPRDDN